MGVPTTERRKKRGQGKTALETSCTDNLLTLVDCNYLIKMNLYKESCILNYTTSNLSWPPKNHK